MGWLVAALQQCLGKRFSFKNSPGNGSSRCFRLHGFRLVFDFFILFLWCAEYLLDMVCLASFLSLQSLSFLIISPLSLVRVSSWLVISSLTVLTLNWVFSRSLWECRNNICEILRLLGLTQIINFHLGSIQTITCFTRKGRGCHEVVRFQAHKPFQGCRPGRRPRTLATFGY